MMKNAERKIGARGTRARSSDQKRGGIRCVRMGRGGANSGQELLIDDGEGTFVNPRNKSVGLEKGYQVIKSEKDYQVVTCVPVTSDSDRMCKY